MVSSTNLHAYLSHMTVSKYENDPYCMMMLVVHSTAILYIAAQLVACLYCSSGPSSRGLVDPGPSSMGFHCFGARTWRMLMRGKSLVKTAKQ
nr:hypothetical protein CFP56_22284 [Quercus suber]